MFLALANCWVKSSHTHGLSQIHGLHSWWYMLDCVGRMDDSGSRWSLPKNCVSVISTFQLHHVIHCVSSTVLIAVVSQLEHFELLLDPTWEAGSEEEMRRRKRLLHFQVSIQ